MIFRLIGLKLRTIKSKNRHLYGWRKERRTGQPGRCATIFPDGLHSVWVRGNQVKYGADSPKPTSSKPVSGPETIVEPPPAVVAFENFGT